MRKPKALSPSALARYEDRREEFYIRYMSEIRTERDPQEVYMAAGSSFDAFVKARIHEDLFGVGSSKGTPYEFETLFEKQVEPQCRDSARDMGQFLMDKYINTGAYALLLKDLLASPVPPTFEFKVEAVVNGVPIMGYPDLYYFSPELVKIICDWKINGSYSKHGVSPVQGFQTSRYFKKGELTTETHKKFIPVMYKDVEVNQNGLDQFSRDWATQLTIYAWCLGEEPGDEDYIVRMEQAACRPNNKEGGINVKWVTHMSRIDQRFQMEVIRRLMDCWTSIEKGHIFTDLDYEQNVEHCELIDRKLQIPMGLHPVMNKYLAEKGPRFK